MEIYRARNPRKSPLWQCTHRHYAEFRERYPEHDHGVTDFAEFEFKHHRIDRDNVRNNQGDAESKGRHELYATIVRHDRKHPGVVNFP